MRKLGLQLIAVLLGLLLGASVGIVAGFVVISDESRSNAPVAAPSAGNTPSAEPVTNKPQSQSSSQGSLRPASPAGRGIAVEPQLRSSKSEVPGTNRLVASPLALSAFSQVSRTVPSTLLTGTCGDTSGDGVVNVGDAITTLQIIVGIVPPTRHQEFFGNLNGDRTINILDAVITLQHIVGLIPDLTRCGPDSNQ